MFSSSTSQSHRHPTECTDQDPPGCSAQVPAGGTAILPVHLRIPLDLSDLMVDWRNGDKYVHLFKDGKHDNVTQNKEYKGRTSLFKDEMSQGNVSLRLTHVTEQDNGTYSLTIINRDGKQKKCRVSLCVKEKKEDHQAVTPGEKEEVNTEITQPVPVWVAIICGLVLVGGLIFWVYRCRTRQEQRNHQGGGDDQNAGQEHFKMLGGEDQNPNED
ncbi:V-set domain-containing T-cell activation inhibitor 1-like isoform X2 [Cheilinus undulatus]|uniref:V-set domain-containing T-cell activation inhibitor 1-like isoform X2 n=1 Tax=Cheilinus undulatus TaxID=241271 RepID=UPI001BD30F8E|nr:V-set domain-containing T-cell activation inhibitor 1-like isoform X2 [Cheilinus undulatus]